MSIQFEEKKFFSDNNLFEESNVTISVQKRNGKKCITIVIGMATDLDLPKIVSYLKKTYKDSYIGLVVLDYLHLLILL